MARDNSYENDAGRDFKKYKIEMESHRRKYERYKNQCNHQKPNGKYKIDPVRAGVYKCKDCGTVFDITPISEERLNEFLTVSSNMLNQMKLLSRPDEVVLVKKLGSILHANKESAELYKKTLETNGVKKRKNRNDREENYGQVGMDKVAFNRKF
jgi:hypothetical protein